MNSDYTDTGHLSRSREVAFCGMGRRKKPPETFVSGGFRFFTGRRNYSPFARRMNSRTLSLSFCPGADSTPLETSTA